MKSGWASAVLLTGPATSPQVADSRRVELSDPAVAESRQPYHAGFGTAREAGRDLTRLVADVKRFGRQSVASVMRDYRRVIPDLRGAGVVVVDALPGPASWATHLHSLTGVYPITKRPRGTDAPILAVQPVLAGGAEQFAVWHHNVASGFPLPTVPVPLRGASAPALDLEATYATARAGRELHRAS